MFWKISSLTLPNQKTISVREPIKARKETTTQVVKCQTIVSGHEDKQKFLKALKNRQDLFQEEGILNLILDAIDKMNVITGQGLLSALAGEVAGQQWDEVSGYLYQLLGKDENLKDI